MLYKNDTLQNAIKIAKENKLNDQAWAIHQAMTSMDLAEPEITETLQTEKSKINFIQNQTQQGQYKEVMTMTDSHLGLSVLKEILPHIDQEYVLYKEQNVENPTWGNWVSIHGVVFKDNTFMIFVSDELQVSEYSGESNFALDEGSLNDIQRDIEDDTAEIIMSRIDNNDDYDEDTIGLVLAIQSSYQDQDDPSFDPHEAHNKAWLPEDEEKAEEIAMLAFIHLAETKKASMDVNLAGESSDENITIYDADGIDGAAYEKLVADHIDFSNFIGCSYEYNDGAYDRRSGYSEDATIVYLTLNMTDYSAHQLMEYKNRAKALFKKEQTS